MPYRNEDNKHATGETIIHSKHIVSQRVRLFLGWFYGDQRHFQQYFSYIVAVSFIGGGNLSIRKKSLNCLKKKKI
jgi:hypothetical protein